MISKSNREVKQAKSLTRFKQKSFRNEEEERHSSQYRTGYNMDQSNLDEKNHLEVLEGDCSCF